MRQRSSKYGITQEQVEDVLKATECGICEVTLTTLYDKKIDHCHITGRVRGVLCNTCNQMLGKIEKGKNILKNVNKWLSQNQYND